MWYCIGVVCRRHRGMTISEIISCKIGPVLFILVLTTDHLLALSRTTGTLGNCHVSYALNNQLVKLITFRPLIQLALIQVCQSLCSLLTTVAEHDRTFGWIRPKR